MHKQTLSIAVTAVAGLACMIPGCSSGGSIGEATATLINPINNEPVFRGTLKNVVVNPASEQLPPGSVHVGTATIRDHQVDVYEAPDGSTWIVDSDGDPHQIAHGQPKTNNNNGSPNPQPIGNGGNHSTTANQSIIYAFDEDADSASATFTLPVSHLPNYLPASDLPFLVQESDIQLLNGDIRITYTGTINDVLGSLWWLGMSQVSFIDANGIPVDIQWAANMNVAVVDAGPASEMIVMTPTNLINWDND